MNIYKIEHKILTLAECAFFDETGKPEPFNIDEVVFSHWEFNHRDGWFGNAWIASSEIEAENYQEALSKFRQKLSKLIPRISLISQCYIEFIN